MRRTLLPAFGLSLLALAAPALPDDEPATTDDDGLSAVTDSIQREVVTIRGLKFRSGVDRRWKERKAVVEEFTAASGFHEEAEADKGPSASTRTLAFLGLVEPDRNVEKVAGEFMAESVIGYYDPDSKEFTIVRGADGVLNRMTIFHELIHALEDQHFDLMKRERGYRSQGRQDHILAWRAVIEGSATYFTDHYLESHPGMKAEILESITGIRPPGSEAGEESPTDPDKPVAVAPREGSEPDPLDKARRQANQFNAMPAYLVMTKSMFPYFNGAEFLRHVLPRLEVPEGGDALGMIYADPPVSTEQILHPEKYLGARDLPAAVALPDLASALGDGWSKTDEGTMGELGMGIAINRWRFLKPTMFQVMAVIKPPPGGFFNNPDEFMNTPMIFRGETGKAVGGWDGDRYAVYAAGDRTCFAWVSTWDSDEDAVEFATLYTKLMEKKYPRHTSGDDGVLTGTRGGVSRILARGDRVVVVEAAPPAGLAAILTALEKASVTRDSADSVPSPR